MRLPALASASLSWCRLTLIAAPGLSPPLGWLTVGMVPFTSSLPSALRTGGAGLALASALAHEDFSGHRAFVKHVEEWCVILEQVQELLMHVQEVLNLLLGSPQSVKSKNQK